MPPPLPTPREAWPTVFKIWQWMPRGLVSTFAPELFRKIASAAENSNPSHMAWTKQQVPLDVADVIQYPVKKRERLVKAVIRDYSLRYRKPWECDPEDRTFKGHTLWSVATGQFVAQELLDLAEPFHASLGPTVERMLLGSTLLGTAKNGLYLPVGIVTPFDTWALTLVPDGTLDDAFLLPSKVPPEYRFEVMDPRDVDLRKPMYLTRVSRSLPTQNGTQPDENPIGATLHGRRLSFRNGTRPPLTHAYFHCCCAVWKRVYFATDPDRRHVPDELWKAFLAEMERLWGRSFVARARVTQLFNPARQDRYQIRVTEGSRLYNQIVKYRKLDNHLPQKLWIPSF